MVFTCAMPCSAHCRAVKWEIISLFNRWKYFKLQRLSSRKNVAPKLHCEPLDLKSQAHFWGKCIAMLNYWFYVFPPCPTACYETNMESVFHLYHFILKIVFVQFSRSFWYFSVFSTLLSIITMMCSETSAISHFLRCKSICIFSRVHLHCSHFSDVIQESGAGSKIV